MTTYSILECQWFSWLFR